MVQIIEEDSPGGRLGSAVGSGLSAGIQALVENRLERLKNSKHGEYLSRLAKAQGLSDEDAANLINAPEPYQKAFQKQAEKDEYVLENYLSQLRGTDKEEPQTDRKASFREAGKEVPKEFLKGTVRGTASLPELLSQKQKLPLWALSKITGDSPEEIKKVLGPRLTGLIEGLTTPGMPGENIGPVSTETGIGALENLLGYQNKPTSGLGRGARRAGEAVGGLLGLGEIAPAAIGLGAAAGAGGQAVEEATGSPLAGFLAEIGIFSAGGLKSLLRKASKGNKSAVTKVNELVGRVQKAEPSLSNEQILRNFEEFSNAPGQSRQRQILDEQLRYYKRTPSVQKEVIGEQERLAARRPKSEKPELKAEARSKIPEAQKEVDQFKTALGKEEDKLRLAKKSKSPKSEIGELENRIDRLKTSHDLAKEELNRFKYEYRTGQEYKSPQDLKTYATNKAEAIANDIKTKTPEAITKENELDRLAQEYQGRKTIPGSERLPEQTNEKLYKALEKAYKERREEVGRLLRYARGDQETNLLKERDVLDKLIRQQRDRMLVHRRRLGLKELGETVAREGKLKGKLSDSEAAKLAKKQLGIKNESQAKEFVGQVKGMWSDIEKSINKAKTRSGKKSELNKGIKLIKKTASSLGLTLTPRRILKFLAHAFGYGSLPITGLAAAKAVSRNVRASKASKQTPEERMKYFKRLKEKGMSTTEINRIKRKEREKRRAS